MGADPVTYAWIASHSELLWLWEFTRADLDNGEVLSAPRCIHCNTFFQEQDSVWYAQDDYKRLAWYGAFSGLIEYGFCRSCVKALRLRNRDVPLPLLAQSWCERFGVSVASRWLEFWESDISARGKCFRVNCGECGQKVWAPSLDPDYPDLDVEACSAHYVTAKPSKPKGPPE